jgi:hypothetical protein
MTWVRRMLLPDGSRNDVSLPDEVAARVDLRLPWHQRDTVSELEVSVPAEKISAIGCRMHTSLPAVSSFSMKAHWMPLDDGHALCEPQPMVPPPTM